jgi:hypothetical protein
MRDWVRRSVDGRVKPGHDVCGPRRFALRKRAEPLSAHDALVAKAAQAQAANAAPRRDAR